MATAPEPIAIVGMACVFPGAGDLASFWANLQAGVDAISEVPAGRLDPIFLDAARPAIDRVYCRRGGFIDAHATFDPLAFGVMPSAAEGAEPDQLLTLQVAHAALLDAGLGGEGGWRRRTAVVIGRGGYPTPGLVRLEQRVRTAQQVVEVLRSQAPGLSESTLRTIKEAFQERFGAFGPDTAIGLVPNLAASRVANRLDLEGPAYTVDAACASSLVALDQACRELWSGRCEVAIAGGVHLCQDISFWSVFTQLGALSRSGEIRPFDRRADGLLIGEGVGLVVLKRLADAQRDDDRVYARVRGVGISSDGRGTTLLNPRAEGQILALERAWSESGLSAEEIDLVEAHGTGTTQGDATELTTLGRFFGAPSGARAALGSVKSMIGHAMPAAGAAGLIKSALALHHGVIPPSLHCEEPHPLIESTRFQVASELRPWPESQRTRRVAAVNAFGFGGINAHAVLEAPASRPSGFRSRPPASAPVVAETVLALAAPTREALLDALDRGETATGDGPCRLVVFDPSPERLGRARTLVERGRPWQGHQDFWFAERGLLADGGKIAFLFPGLEPTFEPRVDDVAAFLGRPPPAAPVSNAIEATGVAVVEVGRLLARALQGLGIEPAAYAGHSVGEWTGMIASGMIPASAAEAFIDSVVPGGLQIPDVAFAAAGCSVARARELTASIEGLHVSHDNCPHQVILCGPSQAMEEALTRFRQGAVLAQVLPFRSGFHSPTLAPYLEMHQRHFASLPLGRPRLPLWSATTCAPYPVEPEAIRALAIEHLVRPVRFRELIENLHGAGFRLFIQVGAGNSLIGFADDTLRGKAHLAIASNVRQRPGLAQLHRVAAAVFGEGGPNCLAALTPPAPRIGKPLRLDVPLVRLPRLSVPPAPDLGAPGTVAARYAESLRHLGEAQGQVVAALHGALAQPGPRAWSQRRPVSLESQPYLLDHCFYRQPEGWAELADRFPIVPMTLLLEWLREAAEAASGRELEVLEEVRALRWLAAAPSTEAVIHTSLRDDGGYEVSLEGHARARLGNGEADSPGWVPPPPLIDPRVSPVSAEEVYRQRWMFHGPAYQGIHALRAWAADGVDAELETPSAPGALLDNAGQVLGLWVMLHTQVDRMAFPVAMERVQFFGAAPQPGEHLHCAVRVLGLDDRGVRANVWLWHLDGRPFCRITGWEDRRFDSTPRLWEVLRWPERHLLAVPRPEGYLLATDAWRNLPSRELIGRRYLGVRERAQMEALPAREQSAWLNGRIAVKDAVRNHLWRQGHGPLFPVEVEVTDDAEGRPQVRGPFSETIQVSLSAVEGGAVARVGPGSAVGVGLDHAEHASTERSAPTLSPEERVHLPAGAEWLIRVGVAREALSKALRLRGKGVLVPGPLEAIEGDRLRLGGQWVQVVQDGPFLVGWSELS